MVSQHTHTHTCTHTHTHTHTRTHTHTHTHTHTNTHTTYNVGTVITPTYKLEAFDKRVKKFKSTAE